MYGRLGGGKVGLIPTEHSMATNPRPTRARPVGHSDPRLAVAALLTAGKDGTEVGIVSLVSSQRAVTATNVATAAIELGGPFRLSFPQFVRDPAVPRVSAEVAAVDNVLGFALLHLSGALPHPFSPEILGTGEVPSEQTDCSVVYFDREQAKFQEISGPVAWRAGPRFNLKTQYDLIPDAGSPVFDNFRLVGMVAPPLMDQHHSGVRVNGLVEVLSTAGMAESEATHAIRLLLPWIGASQNAPQNSSADLASASSNVSAPDSTQQGSTPPSPDNTVQAGDPNAATSIPEPLGPLPESLTAGLGNLVGYPAPAANPTPKVASDLWCDKDALGYEAYGRTIASLITHKETLAPLTIGIKAPWGAGKTSLMKRVQHLLDGYAELSEGSKIAILQEQRTPETTLRELLEQLKASTKPQNLEAKRSKDGEAYGLPHRTTVWFNAWKYQTSEQVWAGMAHCIISQITARMGVKEREWFWLRLHGRRVNVEEVRKKVYELVLRRLLPTALLVLAVCAIVFWVAALLPIAAPWWRYVLRGASLIWAGYTLTREWSEKLSEKAADTMKELIREPDYEGKMGYLHLVESDMREVLQLATQDSVTKEKPNGDPLIVFVDDLDRCAPSKVAEVVEAINLFLCGDYPNCIFVLGMEPGMVAAALEVANKDVIEKAVAMGVADPAVPVGWRFMEKIVQLPITIPPPTTGGKTSYVESLTGVLEADRAMAERFPTANMPRTSTVEVMGMKIEGDSFTKIIEDVRKARELAAIPAKEEDVQKFVKEIEAGTLGEVEARSDKILAEAPAEQRRAAAEASKRVYARTFSERDPAIANFVNEVAELVDGNPRQIKRYVNVFRFYSTLRHSLRVDGSLKPEEIPTDEMLAKFVAMSIHWPHAVDCLRLKKDGKTTVLAQLEEQSRKTDGNWEDFVGEKGLKLGPWAARNQFREFLSKGQRLCEKEGHGMW